MRPALFPTGLATKDSKKKWLIFEINRYRNFIKFHQTIKLIVSFLIASLCFNLIQGGVGIGVAVAGILVFDFIYEFFVFMQLRDFYIELAEACFDIETNGEHDFRILMNRVENFIKTKDSDRREEFYKALEDCYTGLSIKTTIKESLEDLVKEIKKS